MERIPEWRGADIRITSDFEKDFNDPNYFDHDLTVRTSHARPATWFVFQMRDHFDGWLDYGNKYGFYELLAQAVHHLLELQHVILVAMAQTQLSIIVLIMLSAAVVVAGQAVRILVLLAVALVAEAQTLTVVILLAQAVLTTIALRELDLVTMVGLKVDLLVLTILPLAVAVRGPLGATF